MTLHYTTYVLPAAVSPLPFDYDLPFLVLAATEAAEIPSLPLVTSLHVDGNEAMPLIHASMYHFAFPVNDDWIRAVREGYDNRAKVVLLREPVPSGRLSDGAPKAEGIVGMPAWTEDMLFARIHCATRDVPVTFGPDPLAMGMDPTAPTTYPAWAENIIGAQPS